MDEFITSSGHVLEDDEALHLGLTFSFPVEQTALDKGVLLTWTKGFAAKNAIGKDVVRLLQDAFDRKHLHVKCAALVNDVSLYIPQLHSAQLTVHLNYRPSAHSYLGHTHQEAVYLVGRLHSVTQRGNSYFAGAIFGTGTNGAYVEDVHKIKKLANSPALQGVEKMVVNTEWGAFNNSVSFEVFFRECRWSS